MLTLNNRGSIFLLALTVLSVLFILGISMAFFGSAEDWASAMSYESEVAFNLAESAIEEFTARLKTSLNNEDPSNELYRVLRAHDLDLSRDIPLQPAELAALTAYTRETARQIYSIEFGTDMVHSNDFKMEAVISLDHIDGVQASMGESTLYELKKDKKEKQGRLSVTAEVTYKNHTATVSLEFLIRVVRTFIPPFNYFTLFVRDASVYGGSHFNTFESSAGYHSMSGLRLDHGWNSISPGFDPTDYDYWEEMLSRIAPTPSGSSSAPTPPGRVYLGQDLDSYRMAGPGVFIRSANGVKLLFPGDDLNPNVEIMTQMNARENLFLLFDVLPWTGLRRYVNNYMELQGQERTKEGRIFTGWSNDHEIRVFNVGAGRELMVATTDGPPSFRNSFMTYHSHTRDQIHAAPGGINSDEGEMRNRLMPELGKSGLQVFGSAPLPRHANPSPRGPADFSKLSPTLVYGSALRRYFRAVEVKPDGGDPIELAFVDPDNDFVKNYLEAEGIRLRDELNATQAAIIFRAMMFGEVSRGSINPADVESFVEPIVRNWDLLPDGLKRLDNYTEFMSNEGTELYNTGLGHFIQRLRGSKDKYDGDLKPFMSYFLEGYPYPYNPQMVDRDLEQIIRNNPMREFYEGPLWEALPDRFNSYLLDFYFIPRSTEDFFRGRMTVPIGGESYDRFVFKYIDNPQEYLGGANEQVLELNGILTLNDSEILGLRNLRFRGNGIIYSSPMMGGGQVLIAGHLAGVDTALDDSFNSTIGNGMLTIVAPHIVIDTSHADGDICYVEANLISVAQPLQVIGDKPVHIKGTVVTPFLNLEEHFQNLQGLDPPAENVIIYNALNGIWRNKMPELMNQRYVAKIVSGGVGKFEWSYERGRR